FGLPTASQTKASTYFAGNVAVNPDGKYVVFGSQKLQLGETATGNVITTAGFDKLPLDPSAVGFMTPAFSPDGKKLAMVEGAGSWYHNLMNGKLVVVDFDQASAKVSNLVSLAPASMFTTAQHAIAYPSFAPDSSHVAFHVGDYATGCDAQGCDANATQIGAI